MADFKFFNTNNCGYQGQMSQEAIEYFRLYLIYSDEGEFEHTTAIAAYRVNQITFERGEIASARVIAVSLREPGTKIAFVINNRTNDPFIVDHEVITQTHEAV